MRKIPNRMIFEVDKLTLKVKFRLFLTPPPITLILKIQLFPLGTYVGSEKKLFLILYPLFENSTTVLPFA